MTALHNFRVIIGGGGISGLTLANALEKAGIDYILLEARNTITPHVGASIGLFPNSNRIIDQLGCYELVENEICQLTHSNMRYATGKQFGIFDGFMMLHRRHNYPAAFLERETLLGILYGNLKEQSKIQLRKRITKVEHNREEVTVVCEDGTVVSGDVLVGCDGVHSQVRNELWRLSHMEEPEAIDPNDKEMLFAEYDCMYGISTPTNGIFDGVVETVFNEGSSALIVGGKAKVFWFMFRRLNKVFKMPDIPRYTKQDAELYAEKLQDVTITPDVKFSDIWKNVVSYTLVSTEEAQLKRWSWGRIACIGDGVHKMTPNMGAGGNAAVETAVALANELKKLKDEAKKGKPSYETIRERLGNYQKLRETRLSAVLKASNDLTRIHALKTVKDKFMAYWVLPNADEILTGVLPSLSDSHVSDIRVSKYTDAASLDNINCDMIIGSVKLDYLPVPDRSLHGTMPFNPSQGLGQTESRLMRAAKALPILGISYLAVSFMSSLPPPMTERAAELMSQGVTSLIGKRGFFMPLKHFFGLDFVDSQVKWLTCSFASLQFVEVIGHWQTFSFLIDAGILYTIVLFEGARRVNQFTVASFPIFLGISMQFLGIGVVMGLWCFAHYIQSPIESFRSRDLRLTDVSYTATVLPMMALFHYLPNFGAFLHFIDPLTRHVWEWVWQPFPIFLSIAQFLLKKTVMPNTVRQDRINNTERDLPIINYTIGVLCTVSMATWHYTFFYAPHSMLTLFMPNIAGTQTGDEHVRLFLQYDEIFSMGACFLWLLYLFGDMQNAGMINDSWISIILKGIAVFVVGGPGVAIGLGWLWREHILATKWHKDALVPGKGE